MSRIAVSEVTLELVDAGHGPAILLLHGIPTRNALWTGVVPALVAAGHRVIAPDLAGFGRSEAPELVDIHVGNQASWMLGLLDALGIERALVVGHDIGAAVAQIMAVRAPRRVRGLVLMDGVYADSWPVDAMTKIARWDPSAAHKLFELLVQRLPATGTTTGIADDVVRELLAPYEGERGGLRLIRMAKSLDARHTVALLDDLRRLRPRALVVWGDQDRFQPVESVARPLAGLLGADLKLLSGGHFLPLDRPREIAEEIARFATSLDGSEDPKAPTHDTAQG
jgi:pimeloyl-ACP methyl ester carboxylesterase